ncbi:solute carrier family 35 member G1 [Cylas formicarius]|uniref:solute carrier family 35 member G1 n=1 Tax=Cylas formicarius TaxID=197179 RepID=UPI00295854A7|nr:solute carrier family 35 member G1 [Cylas formicarius]
MPENVELQQLVEEEQEEELKFHRPKSKNRYPYLGLILATLSSLFFSLCSVIVKWMSQVNPTALAAYRFLGVLLPAIPIMIYHRQPVYPKGKRIMLLLRCFTGTAGLMLSFYAFRHMPLSDASVIVFSVPVFTSIFARMFLKEPCGWFNVFSIILTFIGVVLITRPPIIFGNTINSLGESDQRPEMWGAVAAFSSTLFGANAYVILRALKDVHYSVIMANFGTYGFVQCIMFTYFIGALCLPTCGTDRYLIVALAVSSFLGQILLTTAMQMEQAGPVSIARSSDIVYAFIWQVLFFNEIPNRFSVAGAILVMSSIILTGLRKWVLALPHDAALKRKLSLLTK